MAFTQRNFENLAGSGAGHKIFAYDAGSDTQATVEAASYFDGVAGLLTVGDVIFVSASASNFNCYVSAISATNVVTIARVSEKGSYEGSETKDWGSLVDGATAIEAVTVTGAVLGDFAMCSLSVDLQGMIMSCHVSAADTVEVVMNNESGGTLDLASATLRVRVLAQ